MALLPVLGGKVVSLDFVIILGGNIVSLDLEMDLGGTIFSLDLEMDPFIAPPPFPTARDCLGE